MTKPLDPEIKALRAIVRALKPLDAAARRRSLEWVVASEYDLPDPADLSQFVHARRRWREMKAS